MADFFEDSASGNATYEAAVIRPEAVYDPSVDKTFVVYQGRNLDPYACVYDEQKGSWDEQAYLVGSNSALGDTDPHGGPAMCIDKDGYLHVFYGAHLGAIRTAHSKTPHSVSEWVGDGSVGPDGGSTLWATYSQLEVCDDGTIRLYYRDDSAAAAGDWCVLESKSVTKGKIVWSDKASKIIDGSKRTSGDVANSGSYWYASVWPGAAGATHVAFVLRDETIAGSVTDQFVRRNLYYVQRQADGTLTNVQGEPVSAPVSRAAADASCAVSVDATGVYTNEPVVRADSSGRPGILSLTGSHEPTSTYEWRFSHWTGSEWATSTITSTDNFFDAGTFEYLSDGSIDAYLVTGGEADDQATAAEARMATRGGNIEHWHSEDGGVHWENPETLISSPDASARYNDPQIVSGHTDDSNAKVMFCEWNNDFSNYISKVYLWGDSKLCQRKFTPEVTRLEGSNRIETAVQISKTAFPGGSDGVILANAWNFPDVLCGVPFAQASRSPILLVNQGALDADVISEIIRLKGSKASSKFTVIILGGTSSIASEVQVSVTKLTGRKVQRLGGKDRYETSAQIATALRGLRGTPDRVFVASGEQFADALSVSAYAARKGSPILLTPKYSLSDQTLQAIGQSGTRSAVIVGGVNAVDGQVFDTIQNAGWSCYRWEGADRYATAAVVADKALADGMSMERFVLASGDSFADAVCGGVLAARVNGIVALTRPETMTADTSSLIAAHGSKVLNAYVLGGPNALSIQTKRDLAQLLYDLDR